MTAEVDTIKVPVIDLDAEVDLVIGKTFNETFDVLISDLAKKVSSDELF